MREMIEMFSCWKQILKGKKSRPRNIPVHEYLSESLGEISMD